MRNQYLRCPQCGAIRLFLDRKDGERIYFTVDYDLVPRIKGHSERLMEVTQETIFGCCGCSWTGRLKKLAKVFRD